MADENKTNAPAQPGEISASLRKRLEDLFRFGTDKANSGDRDYAHTMYAQCVANDPSNLKYVEAMLANLNTKWSVKKGKCRVKESRAEFKKAITEKAWKSVFKEGANLLKDNPWDVPTLRSLAEACAANRFNEVELHYLKNALDANAKDVDTNRHCATSLARMGQFDQAIACWARIEDKVKTEARTNISELTVAKTRRAAGVEDEDDEPRAAKQPAPSPPPPSPPDGLASEESDSNRTANPDSQKASPKQTAQSDTDETDNQPALSRAAMEQAIVEHPEDVQNYLRLANHLIEEQAYHGAVRVLRRALPVSGGSLQVQELLEKTQLKDSRSQLAALTKKAKNHPGEEVESKLASARRRNLRLELDVYAARSERYPEDMRLKFETGSRMKRLGNFEEAIPYFKAAQSDPQHHAAALLYEGECLQQMKQYTAALKAYEQAAEATDEARPEVIHLALYRAGTLAIGLKDPVRAKNWLEKLVKIAPDYRDAASRLDKLG